ncbi:MAG TPA: hypothetical protein VJ696_12935 [Rhodanobacteraceae bacterium]|nr:hypothetical protein [Rhodanobacteraceae bacterium]
MIAPFDEHDEGQTPLDADEIDGLRMGWVTTRGALNDIEHENIQKGTRGPGALRVGASY